MGALQMYIDDGGGGGGFGRRWRARDHAGLLAVKGAEPILFRGRGVFLTGRQTLRRREVRQGAMDLVGRIHFVTPAIRPASAVCKLNWV